MKNTKHIVLFALLTAFIFNLTDGSFLAAAAETNATTETTATPKTVPGQFRLIAPYVGTIKNENSMTTGSGLITGMYGLWVDPDHFQANSFIYTAPSTNFSKVMGGHINADAYFFKGDWGKVAVGADIEDIHIKNKDLPLYTDTSHGMPLALTSFSMKLNVLFALARAGVILPFKLSDNVNLTLFPYIGPTYEKVAGLMTMGYAPYVKNFPIGMDEKETYASYGLNTTIRALHFIEVQLKYLARAHKNKTLGSYTFTLNTYLNHSVGLSYQFKKMDVDTKGGQDQYHLFGVAYLF